MSITYWDRRLLCGDGACVGVIGPDGQCKVCKRVSPNWGDDRRRGLKTTGEIATKVSTEAAAGGPDAGAPADDADDADDDREPADDDDVGDDDEDEDADEASADDDDVGDDDDDSDDGDDDGDEEDGDGDEDDGDDDDDDDGDEDPADDPGRIQAKAPAAAGVVPSARSGTPASGADWQQRELCSNGACIGVIGDDGTCKTCGTAA